MTRVWSKLRPVLAAAALLTGGVPSGVRAEAPFRIGVVEDLSGVYSGNGGPNMVLAVTMAVEDFGGKVLGRPIEVIAVDHQNKADLGSGLARQLVDDRHASVLVLGGASSVGLAVQAYAKDRHVTTLDAGGFASQFSGSGCSPYGSQWVPSTNELANAVAEAIVKAGGKKWFFITADYVFGNSLAAAAGKAVVAAGGTVVGEVKHPLGTADMSSPLLAAEGSGADVIGLANAGPDLVNAIKQGRDFGVGSKIAAMLVFTNNTVALGLDVAQGIRFAVSFYWDVDDDTRAWTKRFMARNGDTVPTMAHAAGYVSTLHYLQAVQKAGTDEATAVDAAFKAMPITGGMLKNAHILANGQVAMDMLLVEVKSPKESTSPADLYKVIDTIPASRLFTPAAKSGCPFTAG